MKADSLHGSFGTKLKANSEIIDYRSFVDILENSRKNVKCVEMKIDDFFEFPSEIRNRKTKAGAGIPFLDSLVEVEFRRGDRRMFYKSSFAEDSQTACDFLLQKCDVRKFPECKKQQRGLPESKKDAIMNVLLIVPERMRLFWASIDVNDKAKRLNGHKRIGRKKKINFF